MQATCLCPHRYSVRYLIGYHNGLLREIALNDVVADDPTFTTLSEMTLEAAPMFVAYLYPCSEVHYTHRDDVNASSIPSTSIAHSKHFAHDAMVVCGMRCCIVSLEMCVVRTKVSLPFLPRSVAASGAYLCMSPHGIADTCVLATAPPSSQSPTWNPRHLLLIDATHQFDNGVLSITVKDHLPQGGGQIITPADKSLRMALAIEAHPLSPFIAAVYNCNDVADPTMRSDMGDNDVQQPSVADLMCVVFAFDPSKRCAPVHVIKLDDLANALGDRNARLIRVAFLPTRVDVVASARITAPGDHPYENLHVVVALSCGLAFFGSSGSVAANNTTTVSSAPTPAMPAIVYLNPYTRNPLIVLGPLWVDDPQALTVVTRNQSRIALSVCFGSKTCVQVSMPSKYTWQVDRFLTASATTGMPATDIGGMYVQGLGRLVLSVDRWSRHICFMRLSSNAPLIAGCVVGPRACAVTSASLVHHIENTKALVIVLQLSDNDLNHPGPEKARPAIARVVVPLSNVSCGASLTQLLVSFAAGSLAVTCVIRDCVVSSGLRRLDGSYAPTSYVAIGLYATITAVAPFSIQSPTFHVVETPASAGRIVAGVASPCSRTLWVVQESPECLKLCGHLATPGQSAAQCWIKLTSTASDIVVADEQYSTSCAEEDPCISKPTKEDAVVILQRSLGVLEVFSCSALCDRTEGMLRYNIPRRGCTSDAIVGNVLCRWATKNSIELVLAQRASTTRSNKTTSANSDLRIHHVVFSVAPSGAWSMRSAHDAWLYPWPVETAPRLHWYDSSTIAVTGGHADENDVCWLVQPTTGVVLPWRFSCGTSNRSTMFSTPFTQIPVVFTEQHAITVVTHALLSQVEEPMCIHWSSMPAAVSCSMELLRALKERMSEVPIVDTDNYHHRTAMDIMSTLVAACGGRLEHPITTILSSFGIGLPWLVAEFEFQLNAACPTGMDRPVWVGRQLQQGVRGILLPTLRSASSPWVRPLPQLQSRLKELYAADVPSHPMVLDESTLAEWVAYVHHRFWSPLLRVRLQHWLSTILVSKVGRGGGVTADERTNRVAAYITSLVEPATYSGEGFLQMARASRLALHGGHVPSCLASNIAELCVHSNINDQVQKGEHEAADALHDFRLVDAQIDFCRRCDGTDSHAMRMRDPSVLHNAVVWRHDMTVRAPPDISAAAQHVTDVYSSNTVGSVLPTDHGAPNEVQGAMRAAFMKSYGGENRFQSSDESDDGEGSGPSAAGRLSMKGAIVLKPKVTSAENGKEAGEQLAMKIFPGEKNGAATGRVGVRASKGFEPLFESLETEKCTSFVVPRGKAHVPSSVSDDGVVNVLRVGTPPSCGERPAHQGSGGPATAVDGDAKPRAHRRIGGTDGEQSVHMTVTTQADLISSALQAFDQANYSSAASLFQLVYSASLANDDQRRMCAAYFKLSKVLAQCSPTAGSPGNNSPRVSLDVNQACTIAATLHLTDVKRYHLLLPAMLLVDVVVERQLWEAAKAVSDFTQFLQSTAQEDNDAAAQFLWFREHAVALDNLSAACRLVDSYCEELPQTPHDADRSIINVLLSDERQTSSFLPTLGA